MYLKLIFIMKKAKKKKYKFRAMEPNRTNQQNLRSIAWKRKKSVSSAVSLSYNLKSTLYTSRIIYRKVFFFFFYIFILYFILYFYIYMYFYLYILLLLLILKRTKHRKYNFVIAVGAGPELK